MTAFTLGRMRHLDLLALWCQLHPNPPAGGDTTAYRLARLPKDCLAAAILNSTG